MTKPSTAIKKSECKFIGVRVQVELYWQIRRKIIEKRLTMSEAIIQGLMKILDIKSPSKK